MEKVMAFKSIRRRDFRNNARAFENVLKLKGVEPYLRETYPEEEVISIAYKIINWTSTLEEFKSMRKMGLRNKAEILAWILTIPGVEEDLRRILPPRRTLDYAYKLIHDTALPRHWEDEPKSVH
jgi:hypothetical protein